MKNRDTDRNEKGTFTVWALCLVLILFIICGISVDVWRAFDARRDLNEIADTAARSGASEINVRDRQLYGRITLSPDDATSATLDSVNENAVISGVKIDSADVEIDSTNNEVSVELHSTFSFFLLKMLPGSRDADVVARSSARPFQG